MFNPSCFGMASTAPCRRNVKSLTDILHAAEVDPGPPPPSAGATQTAKRVKSEREVGRNVRLLHYIREKWEGK